MTRNMTMGMESPTKIRKHLNRIKTSPALRWLESDQIPASRVENLISPRLGRHAQPLQSQWPDLIRRLGELGEVKVISRNEHAGLEQQTSFKAVEIGDGYATLNSNNLSLQLNFTDWQSGYAISEVTDKGICYGFRFYDRNGDESHQIVLGPNSNFAAYEAIKIAFIGTGAIPQQQAEPTAAEIDREQLRHQWRQLQNPIELERLLSSHQLNRLSAFQLAGADFAYAVQVEDIANLLQVISDADLLLDIGIRNPGALQIHRGKLEVISRSAEKHQLRGKEFRMNLDLNQVHSSWVVRTPTPHGDLIALELFGSSEEHIALLYADPAQPHASHWQQITAHLTPRDNPW